jgi:hypothetical protein
MILDQRQLRVSTDETQPEASDFGRDVKANIFIDQRGRL